jgi:hypothetical protein
VRSGQIEEAAAPVFLTGRDAPSILAVVSRRGSSLSGRFRQFRRHGLARRIGQKSDKVFSVRTVADCIAHLRAGRTRDRFSDERQDFSLWTRLTR